MCDLTIARQQIKFIVEELQGTRGMLISKRRQLKNFPQFTEQINMQIAHLTQVETELRQRLQTANTEFHDLLLKGEQKPGS